MQMRLESLVGLFSSFSFVLVILLQDYPYRNHDDDRTLTLPPQDELYG